MHFFATKMTVPMLIAASSFVAFVAFHLPPVQKLIDVLPEKEDSFKHKLRHVMYGGLYVDQSKELLKSGQESTVARCMVCEKPCEKNAMEVPPKISMVAHKPRKIFYERFGFKDHDTWMQWKDNEGKIHIDQSEKECMEDFQSRYK